MRFFWGVSKEGGGKNPNLLYKFPLKNIGSFILRFAKNADGKKSQKYETQMVASWHLRETNSKSTWK